VIASKKDGGEILQKMEVIASKKDGGKKIV
jgi:hypothetical protein